jgi:hypothetical protein
MMMLGANGVHEIIKGMEDGSGLLTYKGADKAITTMPKDVWAVVGHNRAATRGDIDDASAHPFRHGNITLVHNGFISNADWLPGIQYQAKNNRVDSDLLCESIYRSGHAATIDRVYGAYALAWHDQIENVLRLVRNSQRPMHMMRLGCGGIAFASEGDMLWWLAGRANLGRTEVKELAVDTLLTISKNRECSAEKLTRSTPSYYNYNQSEGDKSTSSVGAGTSNVSTVGNRKFGGKGVLRSLGLSGDDVLEFEINRVENHTHGRQKKFIGMCMSLEKDASNEVFNAVMYAEPHALLEVGACIYARAVGVAKKEGKRTAPTLIVRPRSSPAHNNAPSDEEEEFVGPQGKKMTEEQWLAEVAVGCTECRGNITIEDAADVRWIFNETSPLCPKCAEGYLEPSVSSARGILN